jgi:hypothetical protein
MDVAYQIMHSPEVGGYEPGRPFGWATITERDNKLTYTQWVNNNGLTQGSAPNQAFFKIQYNENGVGKLFIVLSPDQQTFLCGGNNCTTLN